MADTGGIAALMKALDNSPGLGSGLKPSAKASRSAEFFAAASGVSKSSDIGGTTQTTTTAAPPSAIRITRPASLGSAGAKPKLVIAEGQSYNAKAPRGSYVDITV